MFEDEVTTSWFSELYLQQLDCCLHNSCVCGITLHLEGTQPVQSKMNELFVQEKNTRPSLAIHTTLRPTPAKHDQVI